MNLRSPTLVALLATSFFGTMALGASPRLLPYKGRLLDPTGEPIQGPVDLELAFYGSETGDDLLTPVAFAFKDVALVDGVFEVRLAMESADYDLVFKHATPFLQVTDATHHTSYRRHRFEPPALPAAVATEVGLPRADAPPRSVDTGSVRAAAAAACLASPVAGAKFVAESVDLNRTCTSACGQALAKATCVRGWTLYEGDRYFDFGNECQVGNQPVGERAMARLCCCQSLAGPAPLTSGAPSIAH